VVFSIFAKKKSTYVQNSSQNQQAYSSEFHQKETGFVQSQEMANNHHWLSLLCNYKSIRLMTSDFRYLISDFKKI